MSFKVNYSLLCRALCLYCCLPTYRAIRHWADLPVWKMCSVCQELLGLIQQLTERLDLCKWSAQRIFEFSSGLSSGETTLLWNNVLLKVRATWCSCMELERSPAAER